MARKVLVIGMVVLLIAAVAWAAPHGGNKGEISPEWWPGEGPAAKNTVMGKVASISPTSITLQTRQGTPTFVVTEQTRVMVRGEQAAIGDVKVGDPAVVRFEAAQDGSRWARGILVPAPRFAGKITAVFGNSFTLTGKDRAWNVTLMSDTKIVSRGYQGTPSDLRVGYHAAVKGEVEGDGILAKAVHFRPTVVKGVVDKVNNHEIVLKTIDQRTITVAVDDATVILIRPRTAPNENGAISDIKKDMPLNIGGHIIGENSLEALWIDALTGGPRGGDGSKTTRQQKPMVRRQR